MLTKSNFICSLELELFSTWHSVPHAGPTERVHVLHNDKRCLLQSHNRQVVLLLLCSSEQLKVRPYVVPHRQRASLPLANLQRTGGRPCDKRTTVAATSGRHTTPKLGQAHHTRCKMHSRETARGEKKRRYSPCPTVGPSQEEWRPTLGTSGDPFR